MNRPNDDGGSSDKQSVAVVVFVVGLCTLYGISLTVGLVRAVLYLYAFCVMDDEVTSRR